MLKVSFLVSAVLAFVFSSSVAMAQLESMNKPYMVRCNGVPMHRSKLPTSDCASSATSSDFKASSVTGPLLSAVASSFKGNWKLGVPNGTWVMPWTVPANVGGTFSGMAWNVILGDGEVYPADPARGWPEVTLYSGYVANGCSKTAASLAIETPTPEVGELDARMDLCEFPPVNGNQQVWIYVAIELFTREPMLGPASGAWYDNTALDGHPKRRALVGGNFSFTRQ